MVRYEATDRYRRFLEAQGRLWNEAPFTEVALHGRIQDEFPDWTALVDFVEERQPQHVRADVLVWNGADIFIALELEERRSIILSAEPILSIELDLPNRPDIYCFVYDVWNRDTASPTVSELCQLMLSNAMMNRVSFMRRFDPSPPVLPVSDQVLSLLTERIPELRFKNVTLNVAQCGILARSTNSLILELCMDMLQDGGRALAEAIGGNAGPRSLTTGRSITDDNLRLLLSGLRSNNRLESLTIDSRCLVRLGVPFCAQCLASSLGLQRLGFGVEYSCQLTDADCRTIFRAFWEHPSLRALDITALFLPRWLGDLPRWLGTRSSELRLQALLEMLRRNSVVEVIDLEMFSDFFLHEATLSMIDDCLFWNRHQSELTEYVRSFHGQPAFLPQVLAKLSHRPGVLCKFLTKNADMLSNAGTERSRANGDDDSS